jgi:AcrR family transcriptional regulator
MARIPVEERREALIDAAFRVIGEQGLSRASTRAIVAEAGMSLASFHYAFESRDQLLELLITEVLASEQRAILPANLKGKSLTALLTEGLQGYLNHLRADPGREQAMLELTQYALRSALPLAEGQYVQYTRFALQSLELAAEQTDSEWTVPTSVVARLLVALTDGFTISWLIDRDDAHARASVEAAAIAIASLAKSKRRRQQ